MALIYKTRQWFLNHNLDVHVVALICKLYSSALEITNVIYKPWSLFTYNGPTLEATVLIYKLQIWFMDHGLNNYTNNRH